MRKTLSDGDLRDDHRPERIKIRLSRTPRPEYVSDAVLGGVDGCVTTFAVVTSVLGAGFPASVALVLGCANLVADGFSMAASNYEAVRAQREHADSIRKMEQEHIARVPEGEREEIRHIFRQKGLQGEVLEQVVETICRDDRVWVDTMLTEEHGIQKTPLRPLRSALATMSAFVLVGAMPLLPFFLPFLSAQAQFTTSIAAAGAMFFFIGMAKSIVINQPPWLSGVRTFITGSLAAAMAYAVGYALRDMAGAIL